MNRVEVKEDNVCLKRIEEKCLNCGVCQKTCDTLNNVGKDCINCGQCILTCPSGALVPKYDYQTVLNYLKDTDYKVVVITSPAVRVAIGDEFGFEPGTFLEKKMVSSLRALGFSYVFDTTFGADLTIMEEANELVQKISNNNLPMFTSCCPSWVLYMKIKHPNDVSYLSTCKSPIAMAGTMIKTYFASLNEIDPKKIIVVALTPCVSKKYEKLVEEGADFVITTRELAMMIRECSIDFPNLKDSEFDSLLGKGSGAGVIFGASGGVMESALRTAYYMLNKEKAPDNFYHLEIVRGEEDFKEAVIDMKVRKIKVAVINKLINVEKNYERLKNYDFIEVMTCPGGCVGGGGQPLIASGKMQEYRDLRRKGLYQDDNDSAIKESYMNPDIQNAYDVFINKNKVELHTEHKNFTKNEKETIIVN